MKIQIINAPLDIRKSSNHIKIVVLKTNKYVNVKLRFKKLLNQNNIIKSVKWV